MTEGAVTESDDVLAGVIGRMDERLEKLALARDRRRYFLAVYRTMTVSTRDAVHANRFMDPPWTAELTSRFASLYFDADTAWATRERCPGPWCAAFDVAGRGRVNAVEHTLLGINAHIVYDLPLAVAATMQAVGDVVDGEIAAATLARRRHDYEVINHVLAETIDSAQEVIASVSRLAALADGAMLRLDEYLAEAMLRFSRTQGWHTSVALSVARDDQEREAVRQHLDRVACSYVARIDVTRLVPTRVGRLIIERVRPPFMA